MADSNASDADLKVSRVEMNTKCWRHSMFNKCVVYI